MRIRRFTALAVVALVLPVLHAPVAEAKPKPPAPVVGSPEWHAALIADATTSVPQSASSGYVDFVDRAPFSVETRITGVEFHVPGVASGAPGGMSPSPHPVLRSDNGVEYWRVSGELSAQVVDYIGFRLVVGPIDAQGVNHRFDADDTHPRSGLPGAHFIIRYPAHGFNGKLVNHQAPADGGFFEPYAPLLWNSVDPMTLLSRGYALFTVALGGTVLQGDLAGNMTVDTNPDSGTGIFWGGDRVPYSVPARIAADGTETRYAPGDFGTLWDPFEGFVDIDMGIPNFGLDFFEYFQHQPELLRDGVVVGKRLVQQLTASKSLPWTIFLGWSGSGGTAEALSMGRVNSHLPMTEAEANGVIPYNGGNFNRWHDPASGRRFDAFLSFAPLRRGVVFVDDTDFREVDVDDVYPIGAPMVDITGDADLFKFSLNGMINANKVARALPTSAQSRAPIQDLIATYNVRGLTHQPADHTFMNDVKGTSVGLRYDKGDTFPDPSAFNEEGRGRLVGPAWVELGAVAPVFEEAEFLWFFNHDTPRTTPMFLQMIENLHALTTRGTALPESRIETRLTDAIDGLVEGDTYPLYPQPCAPIGEGEDADALMIECAEIIESDSLIGATGEFALPEQLTQFEIDEVRWFLANNPLPRTIGSIEVPDMAAALGPHLIFASQVLARRLTDEQLRAGFTAADGRVYRFKNHGAYVKAYRDATHDLVKARLWDDKLGKQYEEEAAKSSVLR